MRRWVCWIGLHSWYPNREFWIDLVGTPRATPPFGWIQEWCCEHCDARKFG